MRNSFKLVSAFYCRLISVSKQEISPADERAYLQSDGHFSGSTEKLSPLLTIHSPSSALRFMLFSFNDFQLN